MELISGNLEPIWSCTLFYTADWYDITFAQRITFVTRKSSLGMNRIRFSGTPRTIALDLVETSQIVIIIRLMSVAKRDKLGLFLRVPFPT